MKYVGFDNSFYENPKATIVIGANLIVRPDGNLHIGTDKTSVTIDKTGVHLHETSPTHPRIRKNMDKLVRVFGEAPQQFALRGANSSFRVLEDGRVFVNEVLIGNDPKMLSRILSFFVGTLCPVSNDWIAELGLDSSHPGGK